MFFRSMILKFQYAYGVWDLSWRFWVSGVQQCAFLRNFHGKSYLVNRTCFEKHIPRTWINYFVILGNLLAIQEAATRWQWCFVMDLSREVLHHPHPPTPLHVCRRHSSLLQECIENNYKIIGNEISELKFTLQTLKLNFATRWPLDMCGFWAPEMCLV